MDRKGSTLLIVLSVMSLLSVLGASLLKVTINDAVNARRQVDSHKALFLAEAGLQRAAWLIKQDDGSLKTKDHTERFSFKDGQIVVNDAGEVTINIHYLGNDRYKVTSSSQYGSVSKTLYSLDQANAPAKVFDYVYFINNWGWFYGSPITSYGDVRSNGRFDFKYGPTVNSDIYAGNEVGINGTVYGYGRHEQYQHGHSETLPMPNLNDLSYYKNNATGTIKIDGHILVNGVLGDNSGEKDNIVLIGTQNHPIEINGTVVIEGDVVVSGYITGQGVIYSGRNIYVPNNIIYVNPPSAERPEYPVDAPPDWKTVDTFVAENQTKDLVGFAASENIVLGDYTASKNQWIFNYYLYYMGDEDVGIDGIPDTGDEGEGDGIFEARYEDLDGDGIKDDHYVFADLDTQVSITDFANVPAGVKKYSDIATNPDTYTPGETTIDGIFYTNHAITGRPEGACTINGAIISKDEAIGISSIVMNYDWRINSRYSENGKNIIDLPFAKKVTILRWWD